MSEKKCHPEQHKNSVGRINDLFQLCERRAKLCILSIVSGFRNKFFFCSFLLFDRSDNILTCLKTCLWNPGTYKHKIVLLSSAQLGLVMLHFEVKSCKSEIVITENFSISHNWLINLPCIYQIWNFA